MRQILAASILLLVSALPVAAQTSEFGLMGGGSERKTGNQDSGTGDSFSFGNRVKEAFWATSIDPESSFKIKVGEIETASVFRSSAGGLAVDPNGKVDHVDGVIDYHFPETYGRTGLFLGVGYYRQRGTPSDPLLPAEDRVSQSQTGFGASGGINADFPISRRFGLVVEGTYHWINFDVKTHIITATAGIRITL